MSKLLVKHFGPIREGFVGQDGWIDIRKVTLFLGGQGTGKSTLAKVLAVMVRIEEMLVLGNETAESLSGNLEKLKDLMQRHQLEDYFTPQTELGYCGDVARVAYVNERLSVTPLPQDSYRLPKLMFAPAERSLLPYMEHPEVRELAAGNLKDFWEQSEAAKRQHFRLPDEETELVDPLTGRQSRLPLIKVTDFLVDACLHFKGPTAAPSHDTGTPSSTTAGPCSSYLISIIEEPEQGLHPSSQWWALGDLLNSNNRLAANKLIMTTHSPFVVNRLAIASQTHHLLRRIRSSDCSNIEPVYLSILLFDRSAHSIEDIAVYEIDSGGQVTLLPSPHGVISDDNSLNLELRRCNTVFDSLLDLEETLDKR